jgi:5-methylcytosine-specific restriction endonuclease McrA
MEMNEKKIKSLGGEVSLENCEALCRSCHQTGPDAFHANRRWQTAKIKSEEGQ